MQINNLSRKFSYGLRRRSHRMNGAFEYTKRAEARSIQNIKELA